MSIRKISQQYNIGERPISRILRENNIEIRHNEFYRKKYCDERYFDTIDTEDKAYWLGFIYADGCITHCTKTPTLEIKLAETDKSHLEKFKTSLKSEHHVGTYVSTCGYNVGKTYCSLSITNQHLAEGLISNGVVYRKTHILQFPTIDQVPKHLVRHFIRGYFDGDGSVYCCKCDGVGNISFTGTEHMLNGILNELKSVIPTTTKVYKYKNKDIYDLKIGGSNYFSQCYEFLYNDATIFLERKKNKFDEILSK